MSLHDDKQAFYSTSRYLRCLLTIDNPYLEGMANQFYPPELQLNKPKIHLSPKPFSDFHLSISIGLCFINIL